MQLKQQDLSPYCAGISAIFVLPSDMFLAIGIWQAVLIGILIFGIMFLSFLISFIKKQQKRNKKQ